mgnify:FL=1
MLVWSAPFWFYSFPTLKYQQQQKWCWKKIFNCLIKSKAWPEIKPEACWMQRQSAKLRRKAGRRHVSWRTFTKLGWVVFGTIPMTNLIGRKGRYLGHAQVTCIAVQFLIWQSGVTSPSQQETRPCWREEPCFEVGNRPSAQPSYFQPVPCLCIWSNCLNLTLFSIFSVRYVVCSGVVDDIRSFFIAIHGPLYDNPAAVNYAQACLALLSATAQYLGSRWVPVVENSRF